MSLGALIGDNSGSPYCDVQVQWDPTAGRWLFAFLFCDTFSTIQFIVFGWSKTADPSDLVSGWCFFGIRTNPLFFDYPKLGHNSKFLILGGNFYNVGVSPTNPPLVTAAIAWVVKPPNGSPAPCSRPQLSGTKTTAGYLKTGDGVTNAFTPVPVNTITAATDGYIVSAYDPAGGNGQAAVTTRNKLAVWHIDSAGVLHQNSDITVASYTFPSPAPQLGSANLIDTLDGRLTQAVGDPAGGIWFQHTVDGGVGGRSVVHWYEIQVAGSVASLTQQGDIANTTDWVFNAAISPRFDGLGAAIFYSRSSSSIDPVIAGQDRLSSTTPGAMEPGELVLASSTAKDEDLSCESSGTGFPCRWGDYSGASPDPVHTNVVWGTNEWIGPTPSGPTFPAWVDQNFAVLFVETPANVGASAGDQSAQVRWTAPVDPGTPITTFTISVYVGLSNMRSFDVPGTARSVIVSGLTNGTTYTFTVTAHATGGSSPESAHSNAVTPTRGDAQSSSSTVPPRVPVIQSSPVPPPTRP